LLYLFARRDIVESKEKESITRKAVNEIKVEIEKMEKKMLA
jgi:hypothetical protein